MMVFPLLVCAAVLAQSQPPPGRGDGGQALERIERLRKIRLIEILDLNEEQSVRFFSRLNEFERAKKELGERRDAVLDRIERLLRNNAPSGEIEALFPELLDLQRKHVEDQRSFSDSLADLLSVEQRARLLLFERHFERELRQAMREAQRQRRGSPGTQP